MKLYCTPILHTQYETDNIVIPLQKGQEAEIRRCFKTFEELSLDKEYTLKIEPVRRRRSLDANAYFWVLCGELAKKLNKNNKEVYRQLVLDNGSYQVVWIEAEAIESLKRQWESNGDGWIVVDCGTNDPYRHVIKLYPGSSTYDTKEMSRLIDATIEECKEQGIETMTPDEIERLKQNWR